MSIVIRTGPVHVVLHANIIWTGSMCIVLHANIIRTGPMHVVLHAIVIRSGPVRVVFACLLSHCYLSWTYALRNRTPTLVWMSLTCSCSMSNKKWGLSIVTNVCLKLKKLKNFKFQENDYHEDINHRENINKTRILSKLKKHMKWGGCVCVHVFYHSRWTSTDILT